MTVASLKKEISKAITDIDDAAFLKAVYTIIYNKANETRYTFSDELKKTLNTRKKSYNSKKTKSFSVSETRKHLVSLIQK